MHDLRNKWLVQFGHFFILSLEILKTGRMVVRWSVDRCPHRLPYEVTVCLDKVLQCNPNN